MQENIPRKLELRIKNVSKKSAEKILFCGWRRDMDEMIKLLDTLVPHGSELWLLSEMVRFRSVT